MSLQTVIARIAEIQAAMAPPVTATATATPPPPAGTTSGTSQSQFASMLQGAMAPGAVAGVGAIPAGGRDEHIGLVERVDANGTVHTIEGNSSDQVIRRTHAAGSALGYVRMG